MSWAKLELVAKLEMIIMSQLWEMDKVTDKLLILKGAWCLLESLLSLISLDLLALRTLIVILSLFFSFFFLCFTLGFFVRLEFSTILII